MITDLVNFRFANVYGVYGGLGGGKTLSSVEIAVGFLSRGFEVISNIELKNIGHLPGKYHYIDDLYTVDWWALPCGAPRGTSSPFRVAIVLDEVADFFDQYSFNNPVVKQFLSWLRHSSKRGQFVFLITQQPEFINKSLRLLVYYWIKCSDLAQSRLPVIKCPLPFMGGFVSRRLFDKRGNLLSRGLCLVRKSDFGRFYDTAQSVAVAGRSANVGTYSAPFESGFNWIGVAASVLYILLVL